MFKIKEQLAQNAKSEKPSQILDDHSSNGSDHNLKVALAWAKRGFRVHPCAQDKTPLTQWTKTATSTEQEIHALWDEYPGALPGLIAENVICLDCDRHHEGQDGVAALESIVDDMGLNPDGALVVETPSGGRHYYFKAPEDLSVGNSTGNLPKGIDVRSGGKGYVIAPGTQLADGRAYILLGGPDPASESFWDHLAQLPEGLRSIINADNARQQQGATGATPVLTNGSSLRMPSRGNGLLSCISNELANTPEGQRGSTLNSLGYRVGRKVGAGDIDRHAAEHALWHASVHNGLITTDGEASVRDQIQRSLGDGAAHPLGLPERPLITPELASASQPQNAQEAAQRWQQNIVHDFGDILDSPLEVIPGFIAKGQAGVLTGPWGLGKTFLALEWAVCVAEGLPINGIMPEVSGPVLYSYGEGESDFGRRVEACLRKHRLNKRPDNLIFYNDTPNLCDEQDVNSFIEELLRQGSIKSPPVLVTIDTLARSIKNGVDTDNSLMRLAVNSILGIRNRTDAATMVVHHPPVPSENGGTYQKRPRGGGMLEADLDFSLLLGQSEKDKPITLSIRKQKSLPDSAKLAFELEVVELGAHTRTGKPVTSCAVNFVPVPENTSSKKPPRPPAGLAALQAAIMEDGDDIVFANGASHRAISQDHAINVLKRDALAKGNQEESGRRAYQRHLKAAHIIEESGYVRLTETATGAS